MKLGIIVEDKAVYKDGQVQSDINLSFIPTNVRALQWYGSYGEIEFSREFLNGRLVTPQNEVITQLPSWATQALTLWEQSKAAAEEAARLAAEEAAKAAEGSN